MEVLLNSVLLYSWGRGWIGVLRMRQKMSVRSFISCHQEAQLISSCLPKKGGNLRARLDFFPRKQKKPKPKTTVYSAIMKNDRPSFSMTLTSPFVETMTLELLREEPLTFFGWFILCYLNRVASALIRLISMKNILTHILFNAHTYLLRYRVPCPFISSDPLEF